MFNRHAPLVIIFWILLAGVSNSFAQETTLGLLTLFTTPEERQLIDNNRYRVEQPQAVNTQVDKAAIEEQQATILFVDKQLVLQLNGVTRSVDGRPLAWIDGKAYEQGDEIQEGVSVQISNRVDPKVTVKTPDKKFHSLKAGEQTEISYQQQVAG